MSEPDLLIDRVLIRGVSRMKSARCLRFSHPVGDGSVEFALHRLNGEWAVSDVSTGWMVCMIADPLTGSAAKKIAIARDMVDQTLAENGGPEGFFRAVEFARQENAVAGSG